MVRATVDSTKFAKDICAMMGIDPNKVFSMTIHITPTGPLEITYTMAGNEDILEVELPTFEQKRIDALLEEERKMARKHYEGIS